MRFLQRPWAAVSLAVSLGILLISGWIAWRPQAVVLLPWAGFLAGVLGVVWAGLLEGPQPVIRVLLALAGIGTMGYMVFLLLTKA